MAFGSDGRYYAEAEVKGKGSKEARDKLDAKLAEANKGKSDGGEKVEAPKSDGDAQVRDNVGSTVPLTGDNVNPKTASKK